MKLNEKAYPFASNIGEVTGDPKEYPFARSYSIQGLLDGEGDASGWSLGTYWENSNIYATYISGDGLIGSAPNQISIDNGAVKVSNSTPQLVNIRWMYHPNTQPNYCANKCYSIWDASRLSDDVQTKWMQLWCGQNTTNFGDLNSLSPVIKLNPNRMVLVPNFSISRRKSDNGASINNPVVSCDYTYLVNNYGEELYNIGYNDDYYISSFFVRVFMDTSIDGDDTRNSSQKIFPVVEVMSGNGLTYGVPFNTAMSTTQSGTDGVTFSSISTPTSYSTVAYTSNNGYRLTAQSGVRKVSSINSGNGARNIGAFLSANDAQYPTNFYGFELGDGEIVNMPDLRENDIQVGTIGVSGGVVWLCTNRGTTTATKDNITFQFANYYNRSMVERSISAMGLWWTYYGSKAINAADYPIGKDCTDEDLHLGKMYSDGTTDGTYTSGEMAAKEKQSELDDIIEQSPVIPQPPGTGTGGGGTDPDTNTPDKNSGSALPFGKFNLTGLGFVTQYALTGAQTSVFGLDLWDGISTGEILDNFFRIGEQDNDLSYAEVLEYVISLKFFPFDLSRVGVTMPMSSPGIRIGTGKTPIGTYTVQRVFDNIAVLDGGTCTVTSKHESFLDYEPVAVATMYIPFCGTVDLTLSAITDHTLSLSYYVDLVSGCCTAIVTMDNSQPIAELQGVMGFDLILTGNNSNQQMSAVLSSLRHTAMTVGGSIGSAVIGGITGNPALIAGGVAGAASSVANAVLDMPKTAELHPMTAGTASSLNALCSYHTAWIQIKRHNPNHNTSFGSSVGYLSNKAATISSCSGFTQVTNPNLSGIGATADELSMIQEILTSGFYA